MKNENNRPLIKKIGIDALGVLLILGAALFGWVPGPGGIPLFLAGLGLLATNHKWARRILSEIKHRGMSISETIFKDYPLLIITYDILAVFLVVLAALIFTARTRNIYVGLSVVIFFMGVSLFLGNRQRINKINAWVRKITQKNKN